MNCLVPFVLDIYVTAEEALGRASWELSVMPFDGNNPNQSLPIEVRLLDRARELLKSDQHWLRKQFTGVRPDGHESFCLYGALFRAEREIAYELSETLSIKIGIAVANGSSAIDKNTAFGRVHLSLNRIARPKWAFLSRQQNWAVHYNDFVANSVRDIHSLIDRSRAQLMAKHDLAAR